MNYCDDPVFQTVQRLRISGALEEVLCRAWKNWSGTQPRAVFVTLGDINYKPFARARMIVEVQVPTGGGALPVTLFLFLHIHAKVETAIEEAAWGQAQDCLPSTGPPVFLIPEWQTVVWTLPNAPNLRELAQLLDPNNFCWLLVPPEVVHSGIVRYPAPTLMRYVPLKRAILTWEDPTALRRYFVKLLNEDDAARVARNFQHITRAATRGELGFSVPHLLSYNALYRTLLMTEVPGRPFTEVMQRFSPEPFSRVGRLLAQLHRSSARPERVWTPDNEQEALRRHMAGVKRALPHLGEQLDGVLTRMRHAATRLPFPHDTPIHGNLFGDQILYGPESLGLVDWDDFSLGDPLHDVGRLLAHLLYLAGREHVPPQAATACAETLLQAYEQETGRPVTRQRLAWHLVTQLLLRGKISSLRKLAEGWHEHLEFVITEAAHILNGQSRYLSLPAQHDGLSSEARR
jgi:hypothetical protein